MPGFVCVWAWLALMSRLQARVNRALCSASYHSARRPWTALGLCLSVSLVCGSGLCLLEVESDGEKLWTQLDSAAYLKKNYVDDNWSRDKGPLRFLIQAKERGLNALSQPAFLEAFQVAADVLAVEHEGLTYADLCVKSHQGGGCQQFGALRFFQSNLTSFRARVSGDGDVLRAVSSASYPDNGEIVARDIIFGQLEMSASQIVSAPVWRMDFQLAGEVSREVAVAWEKKVIDYFASSDYQRAEQRWQHIHVELWSSLRSLDDELQRAVHGDIAFMVPAYSFLVLCCAMMLGNPVGLVGGRRVLGVCDFFLVVLAILSGYGISSAVGLKFTSLQLILPFILVGIGVDSAYVIVGAFDRTDEFEPVEARVRDAILSEGMSVTLTSLTDVIAFLCGATASFPAVRFFCIYAAFSLFFVYMFHITAFCALLALDERRQLAGRYDVLCCFKKPRKRSGSFKEHFAVAELAMEQYSRAITSHIAVKLSIVSVFFGFMGICLWQAAYETDTNLNIGDLCPDRSYMRDFLNAEEQYWGADTTGLNLPVHVYFRGIDVEDAFVQAAMTKVEDGLLALSCIDEESGIASWHRDFTAWARSNENTPPDGLWASDDFLKVEGQEFLSGPAFSRALLRWLDDCDLGCRYKSEFIFSADGTVRDSRVLARQVSVALSDEKAKCLTEVETYNQAVERVLPGTAIHSAVYIFYHHYRIIRMELMWTTFMCFLAVFIASVAIISHPGMVLIIVGVIVMVFIDLLGCVPIAGVSLNSISMVNLIMAIGLVVDYSVHLAKSFMSQDPQLPRDERVVLTMKEIGLSVVKGIVSTLVAVIPLAFATSEVFRIFFKMLLAILLVGGFHGLVLMPVLLSLIGPAVSIASDKVSVACSSNDGQRTKQLGYDSNCLACAHSLDHRGVIISEVSSHSRQVGSDWGRRAPNDASHTTSIVHQGTETEEVANCNKHVQPLDNVFVITHAGCGGQPHQDKSATTPPFPEATSRQGPPRGLLESCVPAFWAMPVGGCGTSHCNSLPQD